FLRWTSSTSGPPSGPGRQATAPAALIGLLSVLSGGSWLGIGGASSAFLPHKGLLDIAQRPAVRVPHVPAPAAIAIQPPRGGPVVHAERDQLMQLGALPGIGDPDKRFHSAVQVPVHQVRAADPDLVAGLGVLAWLGGGVGVAGAERIDPRVLEVSPQDAPH